MNATHVIQILLMAGHFRMVPVLDCTPHMDTLQCIIELTIRRSGNYCPNGYDYSQSNTAKRYMIMRNALEAQNRTILYSLCEWGRADVQTWGNETAHSWRSTGDIFRE